MPRGVGTVQPFIPWTLYNALAKHAQRLPAGQYRMAAQTVQPVNRHTRKKTTYKYTRQSPLSWNGTSVEREAFSWRVRGANFSWRFSYCAPFAPFDLPSFQIRRFALYPFKMIGNRMKTFVHRTINYQNLDRGAFSWRVGRGKFFLRIFLLCAFCAIRLAIVSKSGALLCTRSKWSAIEWKRLCTAR